MSTKDRAKKIALIVVFTILVVLILSVVLGRSKTVNVVYLAEEGLVLGKDLIEQESLFDTMEMSEEEYKKFNGQLASSLSQLKGKMAVYPIAVGTPITASSVQDYNGGGVFVAKMPEGRTVHQMIGAKAGLPQLDDGDAVNVILIYKEKNEDGEEEPVVSLIMEEIKVYKQSETDLYLDVTLEQDLVLFSSAQKGTFVIQVPGKATLKDKETGTDIDFKKTITVDDLLNAIQSGKYYVAEGSKEVFEGITEVIDTTNSDEKSKEENEKSASTTESGGVKADGEK